MANVFLIEPTKRDLDFSTAERFGEVIQVFGEHDRRCSVFATKQYGLEVLHRLEAMQYDCDTDHICIAGNMIAVITALMAIASKYGSVMVLFYSAADGQYIERVFSDDQWIGDSIDVDRSSKISS